MTGPPVYSQAARQALCHCYYETTPRPRVEDLKRQAAAAELHDVPASVQAEIAGMSRSSMFDILRANRAYNDQERREAALNTIRERIDQLIADGIQGWGKSREMDKLLEALDNAELRAQAARPTTLTPAQREALQPLPTVSHSPEVAKLIELAERAERSS